MTIKKKVLLVTLLFLAVRVFSQQIVDNSFFQFDKKVDNNYLKAFTSEKDPGYFSNFFAIDVARYTEGGYYYGVGIDKKRNVAYYFDVRKKTHYFAIDEDTKERYFQLIDKVAVTKSGKIYIVDAITEEISYWHVSAPGIKPSGCIPYTFSDLEDIYTDANDILYILDAGNKRIYKYSTLEDCFLTFAGGQNYLSYAGQSSSAWGRARGLVVSGNSIYLVFEHSALVKLDQSGNLEKYFTVSTANLGLWARRNKEQSDSWLESITMGPFGNIYVLDSKDKKIHIFNSGLEYISSWEDTNNLIEESAADICFSPGEEYFFVTHPWGFYMYKIAPRMIGTTLELEVIYPELVGGDYKGLGIDLSCIGSGNLDILLTGQGEDIKLVDNQSLDSNQKFHLDWDGKDKVGNIVPYGEYSLKFYFNDKLSLETAVSVKKPPRLRIHTGDRLILNSRNNSIDYRYQILDPGYLIIAVNTPGTGGSGQKIIFSGRAATGEHSQLITQTIYNETLADGVYTIDFILKPEELFGYTRIGATENRSFGVDFEPLNMGSVTNGSAGFNPGNPAMKLMSGSFTISEGANVTITVLNELSNVTTTLMEKKFLNPGENIFGWDGLDKNNVFAPDGLYQFRVQVEQNFIQSGVTRKGIFFTLDTTSPVLEGSILQQDTGFQPVIYPLSSTIYISPDESSSTGIKDDYSLQGNYNEDVILTCKVINNDGLVVKNLLSEYSAGSNIQVHWDGRNNSGEVAADGTYRMVLTAVDGYGNEINDGIYVVNDNNRLQEGNIEEVFASEALQINTTAGRQQRLSFFTLADGFIALWEGPGRIADVPAHFLPPNDILGQRFTVDGLKVGEEFVVNTKQTGRKSAISIAAAGDGFVVVWQYGTTNRGPKNIYGQLFGVDGSKVGGEFQVAADMAIRGTNDHPSLVTTDFGFVVIWNFSFSTFLPNGIYSQHYSSNGARLGNPTYMEHGSHWKAVNIEDGFVLIQPSYQPETGVLYDAQTFDSRGNIRSAQFQLNIEEIDKYNTLDAGAIPGGFIVTWSIGSYIIAQRYGTEGVPLGSKIRVSSQNTGSNKNPAVSLLEEGFIITWEAAGGPRGSGIYAQRFKADGSKTGSPFYASFQGINNQIYPAVTFLKDSFFIGWQVGFYESFIKRFEILEVPGGRNLISTIISPTDKPYLGKENFSISALVSDANISSYKLTLTAGDESTSLLEEKEKSVYGNIYNFNILDCPEGSGQTVTLTATDKAGNSRSDNFDLVRNYESLIEEFTVSSVYASIPSPPLLTFVLKEQAETILVVQNRVGGVVKTINYGSIKSLLKHPVDITGIADGEYTLILKANLNGEYLSGRELIIDNSSPVLNISGLGSSYSFEKNVLVNAVVNEIHLGLIKLELYNSNNQLLTQLYGGRLEEELAAAAISPVRLAEGSYSIRLSAEDQAGNSAILSRIFLVDRTGPVVEIASPDFSAVQSKTISIKASISDNYSGLDSYVLYFVDSAQKETLLSTGTTESVDYNWNTDSPGANIIEGKLKIELTDKTGNLTILEKELVVDNNPPVVELLFKENPVTLSGRNYINGQNKFYLSGSPGDEYSQVDSLHYKINNGAWQLYSGAVEVRSEGLNTISWYGLDNLANKSPEGHCEVYLDSTAPGFEITVNEPKYVKGEYTYIPLENNITIVSFDREGDFPSGVRKVEYRDGSEGAWQDYNGSIKVMKNGAIELSARVFDHVGNVYESPAGTLIIDLAPPRTEFTASEDYYLNRQKGILALSNPASISLAANDTGTEEYRSGVDKTFYRIDDILLDYASPFSIESQAPRDLFFYSIDRVGNREMGTQFKVAVDTEPPYVELSRPDDYFENDGRIFITGGHTFALSAGDNFAGVKALLYRFDGDAFEPYGQPFVFSDEIETTLSFYAEDFLEQSSAVERVSITVDNTPPATEPETNLPLVMIDGKFYADSRYEFSFSASDRQAGVRETLVWVNGMQMDNLPVILKDEGVFEIRYYSIDNLDNREELTVIDIISPIPDRASPVSTLTSTYSPFMDEGNSYFRSDISFNISAEDLLGPGDSYASGVDRIFCKRDAQEYELYNNEAITFSGEGTHSIAYYAIDSVGNAEDIRVFSFIIDDGAPETTLSIPASDMILLEDLFYISESDAIVLTAVDQYAGVEKILYREIPGGEFQEYTAAFTLPKGERVLEYYAVDHLDNGEEHKTMKFVVNNDYNTLGYKRLQDYHLHKKVAGYDIHDKTLFYVKEAPLSHIYAIAIESGYTNLFRESYGLTAEEASYQAVATGDGYVAALRTDFGAQDIYIFENDIMGQTGIPLYRTGMIRNPVAMAHDLFWIESVNGSEVLMMYNFENDTTSRLFETGDTIAVLKENKTQLEFMVESEYTQHLYVYKDNTVVSCYENILEDGRIDDFSVNSNFMATQVNRGRAEIHLYNLNDSAARLIKTMAGRSPVIRQDKVFYLHESGDSDHLYSYDIGNRNSSPLLRAEKISGFQLTPGGDLMVEQVNNKKVSQEFINLYYDHQDSTGLQNNHIHDCQLEDLIYLEAQALPDLVEKITTSAKGESWTTYNTYCDAGDFIYSNQNYVFPQLLPGFGNIQQIQINSREQDPGFKALRNLEVFIMVPREQVSSWIEKGFIRNHSHLFTLPQNNWHQITPAKLFTLLSCKVKKGDAFTLHFPGEAAFAPVLFIREGWEPLHLIPEWTVDAVYHKGEQIIFNGQLYESRYWCQGYSPLKGDPWKRLSPGIDNQEWDAAQVYQDGEEVIYNGQLYRVSYWSVNNNPEKGIPWIRICDGSLPLTWNPEQTYIEDSYVRYEGYIYRARWWTKGSIPGSLQYYGPWELAE